MQEELQPPTLQEWVKTNPGSTINDYYRNFPVKSKSLDVTKFEAVAATVPTYRTLITSAIACCIGFIGYFSPWFSVPVLHISVSGHDIVQMFNFFVSRKETLADIQDYVKLLYLIPVTYVICHCCVRCCCKVILSNCYGYCMQRDCCWDHYEVYSGITYTDT